MSSEKRTLQVIAFFLLIFSFLILYFDIFKIPVNAGEEYNLDKLFYYSANIAFWLSAPYLLSLIVRKLIWKNEFKNFIGAKSIGKVEDIIIVVIYFIAASILATKLFTLQLSSGIILILLVVSALSIYLRPKFLKLTSSGFIHSARPFKIGDWISLLNQEGKNILSGRILGFSGNSVQLKAENNALLILPNSLLTNFVIENYLALEKEVRFSVDINLSRQVPINQAKRILTAAAMYSLVISSNSEAVMPDVVVTNIGKEIVEYKVNFSFTPWDTYSPERMKDLILTNIEDHLNKAGIVFGPATGHNIIEQVNLFANLDKNQQDRLFSSARSVLYLSGSEIIKQGEAGSSMFVLQEGLLNVSIKADENEGLQAGLITPGEFFGEMSLFTGELRSATITAATDSLVLEITKEELKKILDNKPELIQEFGEIIAERQSSNLKLKDDYLNRKESFVHKIVTKIKSFFNI